MIFKGADWLDRFKTVFKRGTLYADYQAVFNSEPGRRVLHDLAYWAGLMQQQPGATDSQLQYGTGRRDAVLHICKMLRMTPPELQHLADREVVE